MLLTEAAAMLGVHSCALRMWINRGVKPKGLSVHDRGQMLRPTRYRAPDDLKHTNNPSICFLRREIEALAEQIRASLQPFPHPDTVNYPGCHLIPLTCTLQRMHAIIDSADLPLVLGMNWNISRHMEMNGLRATVCLASNRAVMLKQVILGERRIVPGSDPMAQPTTGGDARITHINGDHLDCRRSNLKVRTQSQQSYGNNKIRLREGQETTSIYKGVCWDDRGSTWRVYIGKDSKSYYLGGFEEEEAAARAYDNAARWLFGEYAKLNFPLERPPLTIPHTGGLSKPGVIQKLAA